MISQPFAWHTWSLACWYISPLTPVPPHLPDCSPAPEVSLSIPYMLACPILQICSFYFLPPFTPGLSWGLSGQEYACPCRRRETWVQSLGQEDSLEKEVVIHSGILAWRIPWTEEPGGVQSMRSQRIRHNLITKQQQQSMHPTCDFIPCCAFK